MTRASVASSAASVYLASLSRDCRLSWLHAVKVCVIDDTSEIIQGFAAPFVASWGWFLLGVLQGGLLTYLALHLCGKLRQPATITFLAQLDQQTNLGTTQQQRQTREDVLAHLFAGGRPALEELSRAAGYSETAFLTELLQAGPPGLELQTRR